ncbi:hypothetical protein [Streptomyces sp. NBRC 109706]|uniref:hypothetical protein n=1 Tax=Streptomyces sp. NBRC 109706 TaxID=1550035 RepID=UPI000A7580A7|nr:hypothetical protein [Streptomyces sp. NBRC 109706]
MSTTLPISFSVLSTTLDGHLLMVQGRDGWVLPSGTVPPGRCIVLTARETFREATGYDRPVSEAYAVTVVTDHTGTPTSLSYVLDGGQLPNLPRDANKYLPPGAGWLPLAELHEPTPVIHHALVAATRRHRLPILINGSRPDAAYI